MRWPSLAAAVSGIALRPSIGVDRLAAQERRDHGVVAAARGGYQRRAEYGILRVRVHACAR